VTTSAASAPPLPFRLPSLIKRNMTLFTLATSFTGTGWGFAYGFGPLMVVALTGSASLAGLTVGLIGVSRFLVAYPIGKITDTYGRKPGILLGLTLGMVGTVVTGFAMQVSSIWVLAAGLIIFAMGMSAAQQLRVAAADMVPPRHRAQALGYIALGSVFGLALNPLMVMAAESLGGVLGQDPLGAAWYMMPPLILFGMVLIAFVRPDPKEIGMNLAHYYPGYTPAHRTDPQDGERPPFQTSRLLKNPRVRLAIAANCAGQANMSIVMVLTSLVLMHHGNSLSAIAFSHMFHSFGMFAFTIPIGRLADRYGRERVMLPGVVVALVGSALLAFTGSYVSITLGAFLVGIGWAAANVAATALIADEAETQERGRAIGVNETFAGGANVAMAVVTGPLLEYAGLPATGFVAICVTVPPLIMAAVMRRKLRAARAESTLKN
jgi:MFS family permease